MRLQEIGFRGFIGAEKYSPASKIQCQIPPSVIIRSALHVRNNLCDSGSGSSVITLNAFVLIYMLDGMEKGPIDLCTG